MNGEEAENGWVNKGEEEGGEGRQDTKAKRQKQKKGENERGFGEMGGRNGGVVLIEGGM